MEREPRFYLVGEKSVYRVTEMEKQSPAARSLLVRPQGGLSSSVLPKPLLQADGGASPVCTEAENT